MSENLIFPKQLLIRVGDAVTHAAIPGIVVGVKLFARKKNNYDLVATTAENGQAKITLVEAKGSTIRDQELFLMDYATPFEECKPEVEIKVLSAEEHQNLLRAIELFESYWADYPELVRHIKSARNAEYDPSKTRMTLDTPSDKRFAELLISRRSLDSTRTAE